MSDHYQYPGEELQLFEEARSWKEYVAKELHPFIRGRVLEVGAGIGETTSYLFNHQVKDWTCLEPDQQLLNILQQKISNGQLPSACTPVRGTIGQLRDDLLYDTIIYIDVLEHIEDDRQETEQAIRFLAPGGRLIILSPAFQTLYSPFDKAIGHFRRYTKKTLRAAVARPSLIEEKMFYMESTGVFLLLLNKYIVRKKYPSRGNIRLWQSLFIPVSRVLDKLLLHRLGKTIIGIWRLKA